MAGLVSVAFGRGTNINNRPSEISGMQWKKCSESVVQLQAKPIKNQLVMMRKRIWSETVGARGNFGPAVRSNVAAALQAFASGNITTTIGAILEAVVVRGEG